MVACSNQARGATARRGVFADGSRRSVNLIRPFGARSLRVFESVGMDGDADDRLVIDRRGSGAAQAFRERTIVIANFRGAGWDAHMTKDDRALVRRSLHSAICVPIFEDVVSWSIETAR
jgi:hypothetical protein